jgi:hypothetical protein
MEQEYNLVIVTPNDEFYDHVASIKINLPIVLPIGSQIALTETQEDLLTEKILQSNFLGWFKSWIFPNAKKKKDIDIIRNETDVRVIKSLTGKLLSKGKHFYTGVSDDKDFYLDCLAGWIWVIGYEYYLEDNRINILTTHDYETYSKFFKNH